MRKARWKEFERAKRGQGQQKDTAERLQDAMTLLGRIQHAPKLNSERKEIIKFSLSSDIIAATRDNHRTKEL